MPRAPRIYAPAGTVHAVARCNNLECYFTTPDDFVILRDHLRGMCRTYKVTRYASTLTANHIHLLLQAPSTEALGRPLRWFLTQTAKAFHKVRSGRGHCWERRYRACLAEEDTDALAALRYLDRNPVRDGVPNPLVTLHPSYGAFSPYAAVRRRH